MLTELKIHDKREKSASNYFETIRYPPVCYKLFLESAWAKKEIFGFVFSAFSLNVLCFSCLIQITL